MKKYLITLTLAALAFINCFSQTTAREWFDNGTALKKNKQYDEAINAFKKAIALQPTYGEALFQLGWCYNEKEKYTEALDALQKEEKNNPKDKARTNFEMGYAYKGLKKYDEALVRFNNAISLDTNYSLAYKERGNTYFKKKDYEKAVTDFNHYTILASDISDPDFYYDKGWCENELGKYNDAIVSLKKCTDLDDKYSDAFRELGYADYELNLNDDAITNYRIAITLQNETDDLPLIGLGNVYYNNLKNTDSAIVYYEKGLKLDKTSKLTNYRLGWCYNDKGRFNDAISPLLEAISIDPEYDEARTELGYSYYKLNQYDNALMQFRPVMTKEPKDDLSRYYAGLCYYLKNDRENLKKMIDELKAINTDNSMKYVETLSKYIK